MTKKRHDFDSLPTDAPIEVRPARNPEIAAIADMATRMVPGVQIGEQALRRHFDFDPECILTFHRREKLLGGMAFLYLNARGQDALILGEMSPSSPDFALFARSDEPVAAIYIWAIGAVGRGVAGLGKVALHLRKPRYANADCFAQPSTTAGRDLMIATGFTQMTSFQPDLWCYQRPWKRLPRSEPTSNLSARSFEDARH
ncbi:MAG TPA: hypothetical protein VJS63_04590 [Bradyrhizobium sp.]|nr:hypothetical protein [Bradyrhizobium sp.]